LAVKSGLSELPEGTGWRHIYGAGWLAGIGFTMSLFITDLAFSEDSLVQVAKLDILGASLIAGAAGWTILRGATRPR
jgi:NhaA family Na+:H+ antiporter